MAQVTVILGPGRREVVKVTPATTLSQVLGTACTKHQLNPSLCSLIYNGKELDLALPYRLSGLSAGATVDVRRKEASAVSSRAAIALQLPSGRRVQAEFDGTTTLWAVLEHFERESKESLTSSADAAGKVLAPAIVFMNREFDYTSLRSMTLSAAGISGSSLLRLNAKHTGKTVEEFAAEMAVLEEKKKQEQLALQMMAEEERLKRVEQEKMQREREEAMKIARAEERKRMEVHEQKLREEAEREDKARAVEEERLRIADEKRRAAEEMAETRRLEAEERAAQAERRQVSFDTEMPDRYAGMQLEDPPTIIRVGVPAGVSLPAMPQLVAPPRPPLNREAKVFLPGEKDLDLRDFEIPEDFVETTSDDLQRIAAMERERKRKEEADKSVLKTKQIREMEFSKQMSKYKKTVIRVRFPDRKDLQGYFWADETSEDIYTFVKQSLADANVSFYLYTSPPKQRLPAQQSILKQRLLPAAIVYIGFEGQTSSLTDGLLLSAAGHVAPPIAHVSTPSAAASPVAAPASAPAPAERIAPRLPPAAAPADRSASGQKTPKWFKTGKQH